MAERWLPFLETTNKFSSFQSQIQLRKTSELYQLLKTEVVQPTVDFVIIALAIIYK